MSAHSPIISIEQDSVIVTMARKDHTLLNPPETTPSCLHCYDDHTWVIEDRIQHSMLELVPDRHMIIVFCEACMQASVYHYEL